MATEHYLLPWLQLNVTPGLTGTAWRRLVSAFGSPAAVIAQSQQALARIVDSALAAALVDPSRRAAAESALQWASAPGRALLTLEDPRYPQLLLETPDPPPLLYAAGRLELLQRPTIAIVGSRNATSAGMRNAEAFAHTIASAGVCVASGIALGIDAAAHRGALSAIGSTIAVLGNGIDVIYPRRNAELLDRITGTGLVLSEFSLGTPPIGSHFPRRNRIISGIALGCLVVEAAMASGSLVTARNAVDMGRDVFAIPGSIHSPLSRGCHHLIKQGAKLVDTAEDVLEELGMRAQSTTRTRTFDAGISAESRSVLDALGHDPCDIDTLADRTGMLAQDLLALLMQLEVDERVSRNADGTYQLLG